MSFFTKAAKAGFTAASVLVLSVALSVTVSVSFAHAKWPMDRTMTIVVPWPAGSGVDLVARIIAEGVGKKYGNTVLVENRAGASGNIGQDSVAKAAPDGYTFIVTTPGPAANNMLTFKSLPYNPLTDFSFIARTTEDPLILVTGPRVKVSNFKEFVAFAKANPGKVQMANPGNGTYAHMAQLAIADLAGVEFNLIPYRGSPQMIQDLLGQQVDAAMDLLGSYVPQITAGHIKVLVVVGNKRYPTLPNVPTLIEEGYNFTAAPWFGMEGPKGIPREIVDEMSKTVGDILRDTGNVKKLSDAGITAAPSSPAEFEKLVKDEVEKWRPIISKYKISFD